MAATRGAACPPASGQRMPSAGSSQRIERSHSTRAESGSPGKMLQRFITATFGIAAKEQVKIIEAISDAVSVTAVQVREAMAVHSGFVDIGKRMLISWHEGVSGLRNSRTYAMGEWSASDALTGFSDPPTLANPKKGAIGRSELLGKR